MTEKKIEVPVWTWRDAIRKARVPALTKHICNCIANYVSDVGEGAYPSVRTLIEDSGMSNKSVSTHLALAEQAGLLRIEREPCGPDGRYRRSTYFPRFPDNAVLMRDPKRISTPANDEADPVDDGEGGADHVKEVHAAKPSEGDTRGADEHRVNLAPSPREPQGKNRVKEVHQNSPPELSIEPPTPRERASAQGDDPEIHKADRERVHKAFGLMIAELWDECPEYRYVVELFVGPLHKATQRARSVEDYRAFLASIRDGLGAKDYEIAVLQRAVEIALDDRNVMPSRPNCLKFCEQAKTDVAVQRNSQTLARQAEAMRAMDPQMAEHTRNLHDRLRNRVGRAVFDAWFADVLCRELVGSELVVTVPAPVHRNHITQNFENDLATCAAMEFPGVTRARIELRKPPRAA